jgi:hypothetical protein
MIQPVTAADVRMLLLRLEFALIPNDQRERVTAWLEAKRDALDGIDLRWSRHIPADRDVRP